MYIVIGASRGIGFAVVKQLLAANHKVVAASRNISELHKLAEKHPALQVLSLDVGNTQSFKQFVGAVANLQDCQGVLYCAGKLVNKPFPDHGLEDWNTSYLTNVFGPILLTQHLIAALPDHHMHHLYVGSMGGFQGAAKFPGLAAYSSSKAALATAAECLAEEFKETKHRFNTLSLGAVQTEMLQEAFPGYQAPVSPEEMAKFIADFLRHNHLVINGKNIPVSLSTP